MAVGTIPTSATARNLALQMRQDLAIQPLMFGGRRYWGVKDPVALNYYQLRDEEYFILKLLDGNVSTDEIIDRFEDRFAPRRLKFDQLQSFLGMLHDNGLIIADAPGQGQELLARHGKTKRKEMLKAMTQVLAMRFRGIDPERLLNWLYSHVRWMYSTWFLSLCMLLIISALTLVAVQLETVYSRMPAFHAFFNLKNAFWIATSIAGVKVLHEFAHAITLKHFGGECHTLGFMLLAFTPVLYCDVSDAWMMPNKWHRIAISGAGICLEIVLAALCTFLWWFSEPGLFNMICLNIMFVCSVSTLLFNGNPLLRFDGYYLCFDLLEIPNLRQKSTEVVKNVLGKWFLGLDPQNEQLLPERHRKFLASYAVASFIYRFVIIGSILFFAHQVLKPRGLAPLAYLIGALAIGGLIFMPVSQAVKFMSNPQKVREIKWPRFISRGGTIAAVIAGIFLIPLPYHIAVPVVLEPKDASRIYVSVPGSLVVSVRSGNQVKKGQTLAVLKNLDIQMEVGKLKGQRNQQRLHITNLERQRIRNTEAATLIPTAKEKLADIEERLRKRMIDQQKLTLTAPIAGTVLTPPLQSPNTKVGELVTWSGAPIAENNLGSFLETGTIFCLIGNPERLEAILAIDQSIVEFVREEQQVKLQLDELPGTILTGTITEVAKIDLKIAPRELSNHEDLPTRTDASGVTRPTSATYQARVKIDEHSYNLLINATGRGRIEANPQSLAQRLVRFLTHTFRIEF